MCSALGVVALSVLGFSSQSAVNAGVSMVALVLLTVSLAVLLVELALTRRIGRDADPGTQADAPSNRYWLWAFLVTGVTSGALIQSWFQVGTVIAGGDVSPPTGGLSVGRLFVPSLQTNLGAANTGAQDLPHTVTIDLITHLTGSVSMGQRVFFTLLITGSALSALALMRALKVPPIPAVVGALLYILNPYVLSVVGVNQVFIAALLLLPAAPAVVLTAARGQLPLWTGVGLIGLLGPLLGYVDYNPPLAGMVLVATAAAPLIAWVLDGRGAARRALITVGCGGCLLCVTSAYWIIPAFLQLHEVASAQLSSLSSWTWTEHRATLDNAFWLNTSWSWAFPQYLPVATQYDTMPLAATRFLLPILGFSTLALARTRTRSERSVAKIAALAAATALCVIVLSTGTNFPAAPVFGFLYSLPLGWLLREPGRFLMVAALAYAVLSALTVTLIIDRTTDQIAWSLGRLRSGAIAMFVVRLRPYLLRRWFRVGGAGTLALVALVAAGVASFPIASGAVVPDNRLPLPALHVAVPDYWPRMAAAVDRGSPSGNVVVLPEDDYYQMPYTWGYYGTDAFITELISRPVIDPVAQGYTPAGEQLRSAVMLLSEAILAGNSTEATRLLAVMGSSLVLVRGDVDATFPGRQLVSPADLDRALARDPAFSLVERMGPLALYRANQVPANDLETSATVVTVPNAAPDLRLLQAFPPSTHLITGPPTAGVDTATQLNLEGWQQQPGQLVINAAEPVGWKYQLVVLNGTTATRADQASLGAAIPGLTADQAYDVNGVQSLRLSLSVGPNLVRGTGPDSGWGPAGDCNDVLPFSQTGIRARQLPGAAPSGNNAIELSANLDIGCLSQTLDSVNAGKPLLLSLEVRHVSGANPRLCLWQTGVDQCAQLPDIPSGSGWHRYSTIVEPSAGATSLSLFLYSDSDVQGDTTVNQYADASAVALPAPYDVVLLGTPLSVPAQPKILTVFHHSNDPYWTGLPDDSGRVEVDGLLMGWLRPAGAPVVGVQYRPANTIIDGQRASLLGAFASLLLVIWGKGRRREGGRRRRRRRRGRRWAFLAASVSRRPQGHELLRPPQPLADPNSGSG